VRPTYLLFVGAVDIATVDAVRQLIVATPTPTTMAMATLTASQSAMDRRRLATNERASAFRFACMAPPALYHEQPDRH
jgi:hypothetical protein